MCHDSFVSSGRQMLYMPRPGIMGMGMAGDIAHLWTLSYLNFAISANGRDFKCLTAQPAVSSFVTTERCSTFQENWDGEKKCNMINLFS
jgi:hypothetical protein